MSSMMAAKVSLVHCRNLTVRSTFRRISTVAMAKGQTRIHRLIEEQGVVLLPGCFDALSAVVTQQSGFSAGFVSGSAVSASLLGKPDIGLLTPPETAATAKTVCAAAPGIPFIVDADTGGGNALNVHRTVKDLIAAGAAGCFLEDQAWPKKCGHMLGKKVIPAEEHAAKIASARAAIGDADFFLVARTDARSTSIEHGLEDAISRANLYMEAGADGVFMAGPKGDDDLKEFGRRVKGFKACTMIEGGITPLHTSEELKKMGFHLVVYPFSPIYACARAMLDVCKTLKEKGTTKDCLNKMTTFGEFNNLVGLESWNELEARFAHFKK